MRSTALQAHHHVGHFLPTVVGLAVWPCVRLSMGTSAYRWAISRRLEHDAVQARQHHLVAPGAQLQRVAGVVDVLAGAGKVHELGGGFQFGTGLEFALDPVFHGLHVVVGGFLDVLMAWVSASEKFFTRPSR